MTKDLQKQSVRRKAGMVYFISCSATGRIKIGYTGGDPLRRLRQMQTGAPGKLVLLGACIGDEDMEKSLHQKFQDDCVHGEWFKTSRALLAEVGLACLITMKRALSRGKIVPPWAEYGVHAANDLGLFPEEIEDILA